MAIVDDYVSVNNKMYSPIESEYTDSYIKKRFPKEKKEEYLNFILLMEPKAHYRAATLTFYVIDILEEPWLEAEPHIKKDEIAWTVYCNSFRLKK